MSTQMQRVENDIGLYKGAKLKSYNQDISKPQSWSLNRTHYQSEGILVIDILYLLCFNIVRNSVKKTLTSIKYKHNHTSRNF